MPSKSRKQARFMRMCAHASGRRWARDKGVRCPPLKVAKKYVRADKRRGRKTK